MPPASSLQPPASVRVIAEIGGNHNGNISAAKALIAAAAEAGAWACKFQKRTPGILTAAANAAPYAASPFGKSYGEHRAALEFNAAQYRELKALADERNIVLFASAWDEESADFCVALGFPFIKVASADMTNDRLIRHCFGLGLPLFVSTGMSTARERSHVVEVLKSAPVPVVLMHCASAYPLRDSLVRLGRLTELRNSVSGIPHVTVGYSCHAADALPCIAAAVLGVTVFEKHITLARHQPGGDHSASLEPHEFAQLVRDLGRVPDLLGADPGIALLESTQRRKLAKCLRAARTLLPGTRLTEDLLCLKSPCEPDGFTGQHEGSLMGRVVRRTLAPEQHVTEDDLEPYRP